MHHTATFRTHLKQRCLVALLALGSLSAWSHDPQEGSGFSPQAIDGLGQLRFATSTRSAPAQTAFVRGLLLLHLYEYGDAARSFQEAQQLDPEFAMAYWGEALTNTHALWNEDNAAAGRAALGKLGASPQARAAKAGSAREKGFLDAAEQLFGRGSLQERDSNFLRAMAALAKTYPDDDEAQLFYAQALLGVSRGERNIDNYLQAAEISKQVYEHNPQHPGAAHYWIHGMDDPEHAAGALVAANALAKIAPSAGHAQHMVSHIFLALGMWNDVAVTNQRAIAVVARIRQRNGLPAYSCGHYAEWLQYTYYQLGRHREAQEILDNCLRDGGAALSWHYAHPDRPGPAPEEIERRMDQSLIMMRAVALVESVHQRAGNTTLPVTTATLERAAGWGAFARGWGAAGAGDLALARRELTHLNKIAEEPPGAEEMPRLIDYLGILAELLGAAIAAGDQQWDAAIAAVLKASLAQDALPVDFGPPAAIKPVHEYAGELLLHAGRPQPALAEFDRALQATPQRALSLLGRARSQRALGDAAAARKTYSVLAAIWQHADADLPARGEVMSAAR